MKQRLTKCIKYCNNDIKSASVSQKKAGAESSNLDSFLLELYSYHALSSRTAKIISDKNYVFKKRIKYMLSHFVNFVGAKLHF